MKFMKLAVPTVSDWLPFSSQNGYRSAGLIRANRGPNWLQFVKGDRYLSFRRQTVYISDDEAYDEVTFDPDLK